MEEFKNQSTTSTNMLEEKWKDSIEAKIDKIMENHLTHLAVTVERLVSDVSWLKQITWIVTTASVGGLITSIFNIIQK